jgi:hypothetical protein
LLIHLTCFLRLFLSEGVATENSYLTCIEEATTGDKISLLIQAVDAFNNTIPYSYDEFVVLGTGPGVVVPSVTDNGDGSYSVEFCNTLAGYYVLEAFLDGTTPITSSPCQVALLPDEFDPSNSIAITPRNGRACGYATQFFIQARDSHGNRLLEGGETFDITFEGPDNATSSFTIDDHCNGTYFIYWSTDRSGTYSLSISSNGIPLLGSPYEVTVAPGLAHKFLWLRSFTHSPPLFFVSGDFDATNTLATFGGFESVTFDDFYMVPMDACGNVITDSSINCTMTITSTNGVIHIVTPVVQNSEGNYQLLTVPPFPGSYNLGLTCNNQTTKITDPNPVKVIISLPNGMYPTNLSIILSLFGCCVCVCVLTLGVQAAWTAQQCLALES